MNPQDEAWLIEIERTLAGYRKMIDAAVAQLSEEQLRHRPGVGQNSVAVILRHLGGNLRSRWTNFLTEDGEKPDRDRDTEFEDWPEARASLIAYFDAGWQALLGSLQSLTGDDLSRTVLIRGESHSVPQAILRSVTHIAYHVGQLMIIARQAHEGEWQWLTIKPGGSGAHNEATWGTSASRSVAGEGS